MGRQKADREALVAALRRWGVRYLAPSDATEWSEPLAADELIASLAEHANPRLRLALIPLFIRNPDLAAVLPALTLSPAVQMTLQKCYTAAVCLQRMWSIRLSFYLENSTPLPDVYSATLGLPSADEQYGKPCLYALAALERFNQLSAYKSVMELLFGQLRVEGLHEPAPTR